MDCHRNCYAYQFEVHRLEYAAPPRWLLLVVLERRWGPDRAAAVREAYWSRALAGRADRILAWVKEREAG